MAGSRCRHSKLNVGWKTTSSLKGFGTQYLKGFTLMTRFSYRLCNLFTMKFRKAPTCTPIFCWLRRDAEYTDWRELALGSRPVKWKGGVVYSEQRRFCSPFRSSLWWGFQGAEGFRLPYKRIPNGQIRKACEVFSLRKPNDLRAKLRTSEYAPRRNTADWP